MKEFIQIQDYLVGPGALEEWHAKPEVAADNLNHIFHLIYDAVDEDLDSDVINELLEKAYVLLSQYEELTDFDEEEMPEWVQQFLSNEL